MREADAAIGRLTQVRGQPTMRAELLLVAADCALAAGDLGTAMDRAAEAGQLFGQQGRRWWRAHAQLARVRAAAEAGPVTSALLRDARRCVRELAALGSPDLPLARLAAGRVAIARGLRAEADEHLAAAAAGRRHGPALSRAAAWLAQARHAEAAGDSRRLMHACRRGLTVIDEFRSVFGSSELRAQSTAHGAELAALGQRHAVRLGRPRLMLEWSERWRAVALAIPPVRPPDDEPLQAELAALRGVTSRLAEARDLERPTGPLEQERQRLERAVRARAMRTGAGGTWQDAASRRDVPARDRPLDAGALLRELGGERLLELLDVGGELHALVCGDGRVRRYPVGTTDEAARAVRFARAALRRAAHGPPVSPDDAVVHDWLAKLGGKLDQALLGEAGDHLGDGNLVIVPPGKLHAVPWGLLPRLRSRAVSVAPSAASWLRARAVAERPDGAGAVVLVRGPGLASLGAEVPRLAADYAARAAGLGLPAPVELGEGTATAARVLDAIDGAALAHIAAHGTFRADSPLFSALRLDDGPLTVYDLERLRRGPRLLVLSSCDSGVAAPAGADEVLGLASSLIPLGTAGIVASVVPVNDAAVVPLMIALHRELRAGAPLARALRRRPPGPRGRPGGRGHRVVVHLPRLLGSKGLLEGEPAGEDVRLALGAQPHAERAVRLGLDGEAAHVVDLDRRGMAGQRLYLHRPVLGRDDLAEQGVVGDLDLDGEPGRMEREGPDRRRLRPQRHRPLRVVPGVVGELRQFGVDMVPGVGAPRGLEERSRHGVAFRERLAQRGKECVVVAAVSHVARLPRL